MPDSKRNIKAAESPTYESAYIEVPNALEYYSYFAEAPTSTLAILLDFNANECSYVVADKSACVGRLDLYKLQGSKLVGSEGTQYPATFLVVQRLKQQVMVKQKLPGLNPFELIDWLARSV